MRVIVRLERQRDGERRESRERECEGVNEGGAHYPLAPKDPKAVLQFIRKSVDATTEATQLK